MLFRCQYTKFLLGTLLRVFILSLVPHALGATHNRAGEIHIRQVGPLTIEATIVTWTKASSVNADRDTLTICWGDFTCQAVRRSNGTNLEGVVLPGDVKYNLYVATHTYAGPATYRISMTDPNRISGILNVNPPSSENIPFHLETTYAFQDPQFGGSNSTPYLLQPPVDIACVGKLFKHNPNAFDPDGDSLSFEFIVPLQSINTPVPNFSYPNQILPGASNQLSINRKNGDIIWNSPKKEGEYNLAFIIISWRDGTPIDTTVRDMQIKVEKCDNDPPVVNVADNLCLIAKNQLSLPVSATDPNIGNYVQLSAIGAPLSPSAGSGQATFPINSGFVLPPVQGILYWTPSCDQISDQPYTIVFKAVDSINNVTPRLADLKTVTVKVIAPPPTGIQTSSDKGIVQISWDKPYACGFEESSLFFGFSVWRRESSNPFMPDSCTPGLKGRGYSELAFVTTDSLNGRYVFNDPTTESGKTYCYRIIAKFARISGGGYPYNIVESLPSTESCIQLPRNLPIITKVTVEKTDPTNGQIQVCWTKPLAAELDTSLNPGPYRFDVWGNYDPENLQPLPNASFSAPQLWLAKDTCYLHSDINTTEYPHYYAVAFFSGTQNTPPGFSNKSSSVHLNIAPSDKTNTLTWFAETPWANPSWTIFRRNPLTASFDSVHTTSNEVFYDIGRTNGIEDCYFIRTNGTYSIPNITDPIYNNSQITCAVPVDTLPPCPPKLALYNLCNTPDIKFGPPFNNFLTWTNPSADCANDAVAYKIWYAPNKCSPLNLVETIPGSNNQFTYASPSSLAGCFAVSAIDSSGNESTIKDSVCTDNCPQYLLPNAFSPNNDGQNDLFTPFPGSRFISRVLFQVFDIWGNPVYQSVDPEINWTGNDMQGNSLPPATYYYTCKVFEVRAEGEMLNPKLLSGFIELLKEKP